MKKVIITSIAYPHSPNFVDGVRPISLQKLIERNLLPLVLSAQMSPAAVDELYAMADGIIFSGGSDLDPKLYNQKKHPNTNASEPKRDAIELSLFKRAIRDKKPTLGFCRGAQLFNIFDGGTLFQETSEHITEEEHGTGKHSEGEPMRTRLHTAIVSKKSRTFDILQKSEVAVNCNHHQSIDRVGKHFIITATTQAGIIEIIEHVDPQFFCFGIQSHPEAEEQGDLEPFFDAFAQAVKNN